MPNKPDGRDSMGYIFNSDKTWFGCANFSTEATNGGQYWNPQFDANGNITQITVPNDYTGKWLRINCAQIDDTSILTRNEPID